MQSTIVAGPQTLAGGTSTQVIVPLKNNKSGVEIRVAASHAALNASSNVSVQIDKSQDGANSFVASGHPVRSTRVATVPNQPVFTTLIYRKDLPISQGPHTHVRITITNLDSTNTAAFVVETEDIP